MIREMLANQPFLAGQDHIAKAKLVVEKAIHPGSDGVYPAQPSRRQVHRASNEPEHDVGIDDFRIRGRRVGHHDLGIAARPPDTFHVALRPPVARSGPG